MNSVDLSFLPSLSRSRRSLALQLAASLCSAGLPFLASGCAHWESTSVQTQAITPIVARASSEEDVLQLPEVKEETLAAPTKLPTSTATARTATEAAPSKVLPINLDTVLQLAEVQNGQVNQARSRVEEAFAEKDLAAKAWLPSLNIGTEYTRHEGGIANENGTITRSSFSTLFGGFDVSSRLDLRNAVFLKVNAERQVWQQKGELRRITSETLLDAASTYVDLLAISTGEVIAVSLQKDLERLLERAQKLASTEPEARVEVARIQAQIKGREQTILELR